jgi:5-formyltetrahydrofolate cyclo-ligase
VDGAERVAAKRALRATLRRRLRSLSEAARRAGSADVVSRLARHVPPSGAVAGFVALADEPDLGPIWQALAGRLVLPRIEGDALRWCRASLADLVPGTFGLLEPPPGAPEVPARDVALWVVPGLGFDAAFGRLGRGRGFYDRALAARRGPAIGVGFDVSEVPEVPREAHDVVLDGVILGCTRLESAAERASDAV